MSAPRQIRFVAVGATLVLAATSVWLYRDNRRLRTELAERSTDGASAAADSTAPELRPRAPVAARTPSKPPGGVRGLLKRARMGRPTLPDAPRETRRERRVRRSKEIRAFLGRGDDETEEEYRARMVPLIKAGLAGPRDELEDVRDELEEKAKISREQRAELDAALGDGYDEALDLVNQAVASGDLTPYERNWSGVLAVGGGMGAILESAQGRIDGILTPEQRAIFADSGFEWGEYLAVQAPWEDLKPPPSPPGE